jgi:hypothetical protein
MSPQDLYHSVEDVPSLTSSASTMTGGHHHRFSASGTSRGSGERANSLTTAACPTRTPRPVTPGKRASLASLSRLMVGGSYGEKSKLSIAESAGDIGGEGNKDGGGKKRNRISRLMRFWKAKEKAGD